MAQASLTTLGGLIVTNAAAVAAAMGGAATAANVTALGNLIENLGARPNMAIPVMELEPSTELSPS